MLIGERLRELRVDKNLSQGDIENRTRLLRCYISRVENGHTVPAVETLEKFARALEVPVYQLFYDGSAVPPDLPNRNGADEEWGGQGKNARVLTQFIRLLSQTDEHNRQLLLFIAKRMARSR